MSNVEDGGFPFALPLTNPKNGTLKKHSPWGVYASLSGAWQHVSWLLTHLQVRFMRGPWTFSLGTRCCKCFLGRNGRSVGLLPSHPQQSLYRKLRGIKLARSAFRFGSPASGASPRRASKLKLCFTGTTTRDGSTSACENTPGRNVQPNKFPRSIGWPTVNAFFCVLSGCDFEADSTLTVRENNKLLRSTA